MKAAIFNRYGKVDVLEIQDVPQPHPDAGEILVRVHAATVNPKDTFIRKGRFRRFTGKTFPQGTGFDFAGEIAELGANVNGFSVGDAVFGMLEGWHGGTCAEYVVAKPSQMGIKATTASFEESASMPLVTLTALQALRDEGNIKAGDRVCINGASGGVGSMAVQIAKIYGAHVTALASPSNHDFLKSIGADVCIDYHTTDITKSGEPFDIFFDVFGNQRFNRVKPILNTHGTWISTVIKPHVFISMALSRFRRKKAKLVVVKATPQDFQQVATWMESGDLKAIIHATYPLDHIRDAHTQQESKHTRGKIVITI